MKISDFLRAERVVLDFQPAPTKEETIKKLAELVKDAPEIANFEQYLTDVYERENLGTTGIGFGLALPHARTDAVKQILILIVRIDQGVDFKSLDGEPVKLVFLMGTPKSEVQNYLKVLSNLTRLLKKELFRTALLEAKTAQEMIEVFKREEAAAGL
jgi:fructose-specific phosphotransferase system IIA component